MQDLRLFLLVALVMNLIIFAVQVPWMVRYHLKGRYLLFQFVFLILDCLEPFLPAALVVLKSFTILRLRWQGLQLTDNKKLSVAAHLDLILFDKTGTLTAEQVSPASHI